MNWNRTEDFKIRGYEVGPDEKVPVQSLCAYMEEAASLHAAELGVAVEAMHERGLAWALARMQMELYALPASGDIVRVKTWPVDVDKLQFRRDFLLTGFGEQGGEIVLARAVTDWVVINLENRRAERVPQFLYALRPPAPEYALEKEKLRLAEQHSAPELASFRVRKSDIDRNRHVNNVRFLDWILESVPAAISERHKLIGLQVMYRAEAVYGDSVLVCGSEGSVCNDGVKAGSNASADAHNNVVEFTHGLYRCSDRQELVRAKTIWK